MHTPYSQIDIYNSGLFEVSDIHRIYFEESGNPEGIPVVRLHGGPGGSCKPHHRGYFDPSKYRIILFDQRGCGKSLPYGELKDNSLTCLVEDMEKLRVHLGIKQWIVSGGSWGSTLALAYAQAYPKAVLSLVLNSICFFTDEDIKYAQYQTPRTFYPEIWEELYAYVDGGTYDEFADNLSVLVQSGDTTAIRLFAQVEQTTLMLNPDLELIKALPKPDERMIASYRLFFHYLEHETVCLEGGIWKKLSKLKNIETHIIHGRFDLCCPLGNAFALHEALPHSTLQVVHAGHMTSEPEIVSALIKKFNNYKSELSQ